MRVLLVSEDLPVPTLGGAGKHAVTLGNALIQAGHDVELLGRKHGPEVPGNHDFLGTLHRGIDLSGTGWQEFRFGAFVPSRRRYAAGRIWESICALGPERFDVIHYHGHFYALGAVVPQHVPLVQTVHDQGSDCLTMTRFKSGEPCNSVNAGDCAQCAAPHPNVLQRAMSTIAARQLRAASVSSFSQHEVIFVSEFLRRRFVENVKPAHELRAHVVHNFTTDRDNMLPSALVLPQVPISEQGVRPRLLMVARLDSGKGIGAFLSQMTEAQFRHWNVRIVGDGPDRAALEQAYKNTHVVFLGYLSQQATYRETSEASVCVVPSVCEEACATTILEALALGRPVLALDRGGSPELVAYQRYPNQLVLVDNLETLAQQLEYVKEPPAVLGVDRGESVHTRLPAILAIYERSMKVAKSRVAARRDILDSR